jgi:hypothetical protein
VTGTAASVAAFIPGVGEVASPILGGISLVTGGIATVHDIQTGNTTGAVLDVAALIPGAAAEVGSVRVLQASRELEAANAALGAYRGTSIDEVVALAEETGRLNNLHMELTAWAGLYGWTSVGLGWLGVYAQGHGWDDLLNGLITPCQTRA